MQRENEVVKFNWMTSLTRSYVVQTYPQRFLVAVPDFVLLLRVFENTLNTWGHFFTTMKLHLEFQIKVYCPIELNQPVSAICRSWCNYCVLMRAIIDCWSQQMKINSCIVHKDWTKLKTALLLQSCTSAPPLPGLLHLPVSVRHLHTSEDLHRSWWTQPQRFPLNVLSFILDRKHRIMAVWMRLLAQHVNQLECFLSF